MNTAQYSQIKNLESSWVQFISTKEPFHWYVTLTFQDLIHPEQAYRRFFKFIRTINEELYGKKYREKGLGVRWVCVSEFQKRKAIHFHCLIGDEVWKLDRLKYMILWEKNCNPRQNKIINGFARIDVYNPKKGAKNYLTKFLRVGSEIDFYFPSTANNQLVIPEVELDTHYLLHKEY